MRILVLFVFAFLMTTCALAQPNPDTLWTHEYTENAMFVGAVPSPTGGFVLIADNLQHSNATSIDANGNELWSREYRIYDAGWNYSDRPKGIAHASDGGYFIAGIASEAGPDSLPVSTPYVLRIAENGDSLWSHTYGVPIYAHYAVSILPTANGGCVMAAYSNSPDPCLYRLDGSGEVIWQRQMDSTLLAGMHYAADSGFVAWGYHEPISECYLGRS
jgi:hypothetical protein